jgi:hypothetical protein
MSLKERVDAFAQPRMKKCDDRALRVCVEQKFGITILPYRLFLNGMSRTIVTQNVQEAIDRELSKNGFAVGLYCFIVNKRETFFQLCRSDEYPLAPRTEVILWYYWYAFP